MNLNHGQQPDVALAGPGQRPNVLIVEDEPELARLYRAYLKDEQIDLEHVDTGKAALARLDGSPPAAILLDLKLPDMDGRTVLEHVIRTALPTAVLVMTAHGSIDTAVEATRAGACDFLAKPFRRDRLKGMLRKALKRHMPVDFGAGWKSGEHGWLEGFIGASPAMQAVYRAIECAAPSKASVFISGESGTGKELCAQAIHRCGPRRDKPFIALNCAAIPRELMESEVFGHVKGAFTGAVAQRAGAAKLADGGTLFLDEICELDPSLQAKLLRFIQTGTFQKIGGDRTERVDVRLICATNRDPLREVAAGRFREDLYYRLHVVPLHVPPLRERREDIPVLARHFLSVFAREEGKTFTGLSPQAEAIFTAYDWPGNVRQLQNVIRNVTVLHDGPVVLPSMLPSPPAGVPAPCLGEAGEQARPLHLVEKEAIETAIAQCDGNIFQAAQLLEISPSTIYRKKAGWDPVAAA